MVSHALEPSLYPFKSHYFDVDGYRLHYLDEYDGDLHKPVLLMVHGNPTWSFYWRELIKAFRTNYRVVAIDHMGCGLSDKPKSYRYELSQHIKNLTRLIEHLALKNITLLVHDWGGAIGMGYAVKHSDNIKACIVFNTAAFPCKRIPFRISICRVPLLGKFLIQGLNGFARAATFMATAKGMRSDIKKAYLSPYNSFSNRIATYKFVQDIPMHPNHPSWSPLTFIESQLPTLRDRPMILIWGGKDWVFNDHFLNTWKSKFPNAEVEYLPNAGHYVVEDASEEIIPVLRKFLSTRVDA